MDLQPTLVGKIVELRPLTKSDYEDLYLAASDPLIWAGHSEPDRYKPEVFKGFFEGALDSKGALVIIDKETGQIIGSSRFYEPTADGSGIHIGYTFLARKYWGGLYNKEIKSLMVGHVHRFKDEALFHVSIGNLRSQHALKKIGAQLRGESKDPMPDGSIRHRLVYFLRK